jgi:hypothetical protein
VLGRDRPGSRILGRVSILLTRRWFAGSEATEFGILYG